MKKILFSNKIFILAIAMFAILTAAATQASAQTTPKKAPEAVIYTLYAQHSKNITPFHQKKSRASIAAYFTKATTDLIWKDATRKNQDEPGVINGDPLYNSQEIQSKEFIVGTGEITGSNAVVNVNTGGFQELRKIKFLLVIENGAWKIEDIDYGSGESLVKWLKEGN